MQQYVTDKQTIIKDGGERFQWEKYQADLEKKKRVDLSDKDLSEVLSDQPQSVAELRAQLKGSTEAQVTTLLRQMLEDGKVKEEGGRFTLS